MGELTAWLGGEGLVSELTTWLGGEGIVQWRGEDGLVCISDTRGDPHRKCVAVMPVGYISDTRGDPHRKCAMRDNMI